MTTTTDSNETTLAGITGIKTVGVPVTNQDLAVEFYVEKLGSQRRAVIGHLDERLG